MRTDMINGNSRVTIRDPGFIHCLVNVVIKWTTYSRKGRRSGSDANDFCNHYGWPPCHVVRPGRPHV